METKQNTKILVCCHKPYDVPNDDVFMPIQVGKAISDIDLGFQGDDTGDNISAKNKSYCELTAMYWAWKNLKEVDYIGLFHYRRYFDFSYHGIRTINMITSEMFKTLNYKLKIDINKTFKKYDIITTKPQTRSNTLYNEYSMCCNHFDMEKLEKVIHFITPEYDSSFERVVKYGNKFTPGNMFICNWNIFSNYCSWLFKILEVLESQIDISNYDTYQKRIYGFMAERLLSVFIEKNKLRIKTYPILMIDENISNSNILIELLIQTRKRIGYAINKQYHH